MELKSDDAWDDSLLIKAYDDSVKLAKEELARRIALSTSRQKEGTPEVKEANEEKKSSASSADCTIQQLKVGDYVRATYDDGIDYEAKILSLDKETGSCLLKYVGYDNEQTVQISELVQSRGKKARRLQFAKAKMDEDITENLNRACSTSSNLNRSVKKNKSDFNMSSIPPPPPMPPMLTATQNAEDSEHLSAMLMSWYMSGYYTGVYQGLQMAKSAAKSKMKK